MERRREPRIALEEQAWITILGNSELRLPATAVDLSGQGMKLRLTRPVAPDSPVKIEVGDSMYLGEICYCRPERGAFVAGVATKQVLTGLQGLARLRRRLAWDSPGPLDIVDWDYQDRQIRRPEHAQAS